MFVLLLWVGMRKFERLVACRVGEVENAKQEKQPKRQGAKRQP